MFLKHPSTFCLPICKIRLRGSGPLCRDQRSQSRRGAVLISSSHGYHAPEHQSRAHPWELLQSSAPRPSLLLLRSLPKYTPQLASRQHAKHAKFPNKKCTLLAINTACLYFHLLFWQRLTTGLRYVIVFHLTL